jgi:hypothetical protein
VMQTAQFSAESVTSPRKNGYYDAKYCLIVI